MPSAASTQPYFAKVSSPTSCNSAGDSTSAGHALCEPTLPKHLTVKRRAAQLQYCNKCEMGGHVTNAGGYITNGNGYVTNVGGYVTSRLPRMRSTLVAIKHPKHET